MTDSLWTIRADSVDKYGKPIAVLLLGTFAALWMYYLLTGASGEIGADLDNYWDAALRLRQGAVLYVNVGDPNAWYAYAPWFAWAWVPLTYLPESIVSVTWMAACFLGWAYCLWRCRDYGPVLLIIGPWTFYGAWVGNVQPLMIAALLRWLNPTTVGVMASLKVSPILLVLAWWGQWRRMGLAVLVAGVLGLPALWYGLEGFPFGLVEPSSPWSVSPLLGVGLTLAAMGAAVLTSPTRYRWLAASVAVMLSRPSLLVYDTGYLLLADPHRRGVQGCARVGVDIEAAARVLVHGPLDVVGAGELDDVAVRDAGRSSGRDDLGAVLRAIEMKAELALRSSSRGRRPKC
jgi:hypothetical protein